VTTNVDYERIRAVCKRLDSAALRFMVLTALFFLAISPAFRSDMTSKYAGVGGSVILAVLASFRVFRRSAK
jgi:hypothetical protein